MTEYLKKIIFKKPLIAFLINIWKEDAFATILKAKVLYATLDKNCFTYRVYNGSVIMEEVEPFYSSPEEADSRMFFHTHLSDALPRTVISTDDTDCLLIALGCKHNLDTRVSI